jgi:hypothetical protein
VAIRVLVQTGHVAPREPGFEGGTGTIREQELTKAIRRRLVRLLHVDQRFQPVPCPGDIPDGASVEAALFLHGDGSTNAAASGYSFGFPIHAVNEKLAGLIDAEFQRIPGHPPHREDNYTGGLREYYGYRRVPTAGPEVLVEHGFLTNRREQIWIFNIWGRWRTQSTARCAASSTSRRATRWRPDGRSALWSRISIPGRASGARTRTEPRRRQAAGLGDPAAAHQAYADSAVTGLAWPRARRGSVA